MNINFEFFLNSILNKTHTWLSRRWKPWWSSWEAHEHRQNCSFASWTRLQGYRFGRTLSRQDVGRNTLDTNSILTVTVHISYTPQYWPSMKLHTFVKGEIYKSIGLDHLTDRLTKLNSHTVTQTLFKTHHTASHKHLTRTTHLLSSEM